MAVYIANNAYFDTIKGIKINSQPASTGSYSQHLQYYLKKKSENRTLVKSKKIIIALKGEQNLLLKPS